MPHEIELKILSMFELEMGYSDISGHVQERYGIDVSTATILTITDKLMEESRPGRSEQLCVVRQIRNSLRYVASKDHKTFLIDLKRV